VLIHIPKTGGTSIRRGYFGENYEGPVQGFVPRDWMLLFKFAFVRNPYDRIVSAWKMFSAGTSQSTFERPPDAKPAISLREFLDIATDESIPYDSRDTWEQKIRHHTIPQTHPYNCLDRADFAGRFENLRADFRVICGRLGIGPSRLPHWNRSRHLDYRTYFDAETREITGRAFEEDLRRLGYSFDPGG
jgi:hypothetical protein